MQDSLLFDRTLLNRGVRQPLSGRSPGFNFNNRPLGDTGGLGENQNNVLGQSLSSFGLGRLSPTLGYGGLVLSASSDAVSMLLRRWSRRDGLRS